MQFQDTGPATAYALVKLLCFALISFTYLCYLLRPQETTNRMLRPGWETWEKGYGLTVTGKL